MTDFLIVLACSILGLMAHGATTRKWLEWLLRGLIGLSFSGEGLYMLSSADRPVQTPWEFGIDAAMFSLTGLSLLQIFRKGVSYALTAVDYLVSLRLFVELFKRKFNPRLFFSEQSIFVPSSIPHMVGFFIYVTTMCYLLQGMSPGDFKFPGMPIPLPVSLDQLFSYNGLGLVMLSFCGVGIFVSRPFRQVLTRVAWVKPTWPQVGIGVSLIVFSFFYDYLWSIYTHASGDVGSQLALYNAGTFSTAGGGVGGSVILALATALCAGIGEETLIRGALQPVFGIFPAAVLHGVLHGQFAHAPIFIVQVALWSTVMGIVKRYTNTTTTIIGHAGFNFFTTFLFAFNP